MIVGIGIDVVAVERVAMVLERHRHRFFARYFAPGELPLDASAERAAGRWAAKEAAAKALGSGFAWGVAARDIVVVAAAAGPPALHFAGGAAARAAALGVRRSLLSISHAAGVAVAVVVLEGAASSTDGSR